MVQIGTKKPQLKLLEHCEPGELVRGKFFDTTEWALIANRSNELQNVVLLPEKEAPRAFNAYSHGEIMNVSCLSYGDKFRIVPAFGTCEVGYGLQADRPGQLIMTENDIILVATYPRRGTPVGYYYEATREIKGGQPGGHMAIFLEWAIWIDDLNGYPSPTKLLERRL
jgi:hypothetical protein